MIPALTATDFALPARRVREVLFTREDLPSWSAMPPRIALGLTSPRQITRKGRSLARYNSRAGGNYVMTLETWAFSPNHHSLVVSFEKPRQRIVISCGIEDPPDPE
jgi:hypothetical protein